MRPLAPLLALSLASCSALHAPTNRVKPEIENRVSIDLGRRVLEDSAYDGVEDQSALGLEFSQERNGSIIGWEIGIAGSSEDDRVGGNDVDSEAYEIYAGLHKSFGTRRLRPYLGSGVTLIRTSVTTAGNKNDGGSLGGYVHGGVIFDLGAGFGIGLDLRQVFATHIDYGLIDTDANYGQIAFRLTYGSSRAATE